MNSPKVTLVTGATGLVGNNVVRALRATGEAVRVLIRPTAERRALEDLDVETIHGDVREDEAVRRAVEGVAAVIHCAGLVRIGWSGGNEFQVVNVEGTRRIAEACRAAGVRMVHVSSTDVFGGCSLALPTTEDSQPGPAPPVPYVISKRAAEEVVAGQVAAGLDAVVVNPGFMLGPWDWKPSSGRVLLAVGRGSGILAPRGWLSLCDVRDVADGIVTARDRGQTGRRYILAGRTLELIEAFRLFAAASGRRPPLFRMGPLMIKIGGAAGDLWRRLGRNEPEINSASIAMARVPKNYSSERAQRELGYRIRPAEETVRDSWNWFQTHGYT